MQGKEVTCQKDFYFRKLFNNEITLNNFYRLNIWFCYATGRVRVKRYNKFQRQLSNFISICLNISLSISWIYKKKKNSIYTCMSYAKMFSPYIDLQLQLEL